MPEPVARVVVVLVGLPIVFGVVWLGGWWLFAFAALVAVVAVHEYARLVRPLRPLVLAAYVGVLLALLGAQVGGVDWMLAGLASTFVVALVLHGVAETRAPATAAIGATVLGAAWIGFGIGCVLLVRKLPEHAQLATLTVLLAVFAGDTAALYAGKLAGRHKLAPTLSPGKTWEGLVAGTVTTVAVAFFALYQDRHDFLAVWEALVLGVVIAVAAPLGDLFESALKRDMQVKDTGRLLPGHGGMLDRIDAPLFASVASYYVLRAFGVT